MTSLYLPAYLASTSAFNKRFIKIHRHEELNANLFENRREVCKTLKNWIKIYDKEEPNSSLGRISLRDYRAEAETTL
jgi:hypothetical protein